MREYQERVIMAQREVSDKLTHAQWQALLNVVTYLECDELQDWAACGCQDHHIWLSVRELQDLLKSAGKLPNIANFYEDSEGNFASDGHGDD